MAKYNPFFEKAGMTKITETTPNPMLPKSNRTIKVPWFLSSAANIRKNKHKQAPKHDKNTNQQNKNHNQANQRNLRKKNRKHKTALPDNPRIRFHNRFCRHKKTGKNDTNIGFLIQTKVYLFWKTKNKP